MSNFSYENKLERLVFQHKERVSQKEEAFEILKKDIDSYMCRIVEFEEQKVEFEKRIKELEKHNKKLEWVANENAQEIYKLTDDLKYAR
jgi:septum formation topological specificity factor MinE